jgi:predicted SAM-dependent methyltransferase
MKKVHLGCGSNIMKDWINIDMIDDPNIMNFDLRNTLPFENNSIDFFFCEHFLEHLTREEGLKLLKDIYRCLKPGGVSRVSVPDLELLLKNYTDNNIAAYNNIGLFFQNRCEMINIGMGYYTWDHKYMYDKEELKNIHREANLNPEIVTHKVSKYSDLNNLEFRTFAGEIVCEGVKL